MGSRRSHGRKISLGSRPAPNALCDLRQGLSPPWASVYPSGTGDLKAPSSSRTFGSKLRAWLGWRWAGLGGGEGRTQRLHVESRELRGAEHSKPALQSLSEPGRSPSELPGSLGALAGGTPLRFSRRKWVSPSTQDKGSFLSHDCKPQMMPEPALSRARTWVMFFFFF